MTDIQFPAAHTTTTTVTETRVNPQIRYDPSYFHTRAGSLKVLCIIFNLIGFICVEVSVYSYSSQGIFFNFLSMTGFWVTGILLVLYLFHVVERFYAVPWIQVEMIYCAAWTIGYFIASICVAAYGASAAFIAGAFFGFLAMLCYGYDAYLKYRAFQGGDIAQGKRSVHQGQHTVTVA